MKHWLNSVVVIIIFIAKTSYAENGYDFNKCNNLIDSFKLHEAKQCLIKQKKHFPTKEDRESKSKLNFLNGKFQFYLGEYDQAFKLVSLALEQNKMQLDWKYLLDQIETSIKIKKQMLKYLPKQKNAVFYYLDKNDKHILEYANNTLIKQQDALKDRLGSYSGAVQIYILPTAELLSDLSGLSVEQIETTGTVAVTRYNRIMMLSPKAVLNGYPWLDTLAHEFTHMIIYRVSLNRCPIWLHEGIAKLFETLWRNDNLNTLTPEFSFLLGTAARQNSLIPLKKFHPSIAHLSNQEDAALAYAQGLGFVKYLQRKFKENSSTKDLLINISNDKSVTEALFNVTGYTLKKLYNWWKQRLTGLWSNPNKVVSITKLRFKKTGTSKANIFDRNLSGEVRRHIRTGDLLRLRGHLLAASKEYTWALEKNKIADYIIVNRLASVLIKLDRYKEALKLLEEAKHLHPYQAKTYLLIAKSYLAEDNLQSAENNLQLSVGIDPFNADIHCLFEKLYKIKNDNRFKKEHLICLALGSNALLKE